MSGSTDPGAGAMSDNALKDLIAARIAHQGPLRLDHYWNLCLFHPRHGYYMKKDPLGAEGDFTTAPEISQIFGEMLGAWVADLWLRAGAPAPFGLVELGPGRGTLMADVLRAARNAPGFSGAVGLHLVETSPVLKNMQKEKLKFWDPHCHEDIRDLPADRPLIILANEFFDALPVRQFTWSKARGWAERAVGVDAGGDLHWVWVPAGRPVECPEQPQENEIYERAPARRQVMAGLAARLARQGGAGLIIDYGYCGPQSGDTLQAVRKHLYADPLSTPGGADLTAHVDFSALSESAREQGLKPAGPVGQGNFLDSLGIRIRAEKLVSRAQPDQAGEIRGALTRLTGPDEMGTLFKALALRSPDWPRPEGLRG